MSEFQSYIGIKLIKAKPATFGEARDILKRPATEKIRFRIRLVI